jgi:hypothetical protein
MDYERPIGSLHRQPPGVLADKVAWALIDAKRPLAVTVCPEGRVRLERIEDVALADLIGVFEPSVGALTLSRMLREDLVAARDALVERRQHVVTSPRRKAA